MPMEIKPGDIVRYHGEIVRVMRFDPRMTDFKFELSNFGWIHNRALNNLELVESIPDTILKSGDEVIIRDIPHDEKTTYGTSWVDAMDNLVGPDKRYTIENVQYRDSHGWVGCIDSYVFQLYHIEPVSNFDII